MASPMDLFKCGLCQVQFKKFLDFMEHKVEHAESEAKVSCLLCEKEFSRPKTLKHHLRHIHSVKLESRSHVKCDTVLSTIQETENLASQHPSTHITLSTDVEQAHNEPSLQDFSLNAMMVPNKASTQEPDFLAKFDHHVTDIVLPETSMPSTELHIHDEDVMKSMEENVLSQSTDMFPLAQDREKPVQSGEWLMSATTNSSLTLANGEATSDHSSVLSQSSEHIITSDTSSLISIPAVVTDTSCEHSEGNTLPDLQIIEEKVVDNQIRDLARVTEVKHSAIKCTENTRCALLLTESSTSTDKAVAQHKFTILPSLAHISSSQSDHTTIPTRHSMNLYSHVKHLLSSPCLSDKLKAKDKDSQPLSVCASVTGTALQTASQSDSCLKSKSASEPTLTMPLNLQLETSILPPILSSAKHSVSDTDIEHTETGQIIECRNGNGKDEASQYSTSCKGHDAKNKNLPHTSNVDVSSGLLNSQATAILLPITFNSDVTSSFCQALNLSLKTSQSVSIAQGSCLMSSVSSLSLPKADPGIENSSPHMLEEVTESIQKVEEKEDGDRNSLAVKEDSDDRPESPAASDFVAVGSKISSATTTGRTYPKVTEPTVGSTQNKTLPTEEDEDISNSTDFYFFLGTMGIQGNSLTYERTDFRCLHCTFSTAWRPSLVKHMKHYHKDTIEIHKILDIRNTQPVEKGATEAGQENGKNLQVMKMSEYLAGNQKSKRRVRKMERQDIPGKYHCTTCFKVFSRLRYLRRHQTTHRTERSHLCDNCGKSFKTKAILVAHRRSHETKNYNCPQCDFVSCSSAAIHLHRQEHPNGSVICDICGTAYIDKSTLNKHRKVHDLNRPYSCMHPGCTWRFKTDVMRRAHERTHTSVGKFRCVHCGYHFRQKHHLRRHIMKIHNSPHSKGAAVTLSSGLTTPSALTHALSGNGTMFSSSISSHGHDLSVSASDQSLLKPPITPQDPLTPPCGSAAPSDIYSPATSHLLCTIQDTNFSSGFADQEHAMIEVLVGDKQDSLGDLDGEEERPGHLDIPAGSLSNLEYITDSGEVVQLVRPGQTYMGRDQHGNLVQYRIADVQDSEEASHPIYFIGVDGTVVGATNSQEQALLVDSNV